MTFLAKAQDEFHIEPIMATQTADVVARCIRAYQGAPDWLDADDHIKTVNFAQTICSEVARLTTLAIGIAVDGSVRADYLQQQINKLYYQLRHYVEYGCAYGTVILKPYGDGVSFYTPDDFIVTAQRNEQITGAVFIDRAIEGDEYYTRLEYHRFENGLYVISNRCYVGTSVNSGRPIDIDSTPWAGLAEESTVENIDRPLFAEFRMPAANNVDISSPMALPVFWNGYEELSDLDVAYSRYVKENRDSKRTVLLDSDRLIPSGSKIRTNGMDRMRDEMGLPDYVKTVFGNGQENFYQEINPTLNTDVRISGINNLLSQIGFKCGFSNGYFVFNEKTGMVTATQVEADDRRTVQLIKDVRDKLECCLNDLIYSMNAFADLYGLAPAGKYEVTYDFGDIVYSLEEDKARWWQYVQMNKVPAWYYFMKFEGMTEEEAKELTSEAQSSTPLFGFGEE